jgi:hypothetical protein
MQSGDRVNNLKQVQHENLRETDNATLLDYCSGNDGICGFTGIGTGAG